MDTSTREDDAVKDESGGRDPVDSAPHVTVVPTPTLTAAQRIAFGDEEPERWDGQG